MKCWTLDTLAQGVLQALAGAGANRYIHLDDTQIVIDIQLNDAPRVAGLNDQRDTRRLEWRVNHAQVKD